MKISPHKREKHPRQLIVDLPDLNHSDLTDIVRTLQAITDAFIAHHQVTLQQQCQHEQQLELFHSVDDQQKPF
ncbi:hypothetical protein AB833_29270 [Chromatiales bacterium (ex Bugula neritina AB1)]|nr:hypothetical protein AB833_29270 [Chromatiales bacterium (ex Bugula neritina AB1)]